jgi:hypothetical protein
MTIVLFKSLVLQNNAFAQGHHLIDAVQARAEHSHRQRLLKLLTRSWHRNGMWTKKHSRELCAPCNLMNPTRFERMTLRLFRMTGISRATAAPWVQIEVPLDRVVYEHLLLTAWTVRDPGSDTDRAEAHIPARQPFPSSDSGGRNRRWHLLSSWEV